MVLTFIKLQCNFQFENLLQPRGSLGPNTDDSCWKCFFCQSLYPFCAKAAMTIIHGLQAHTTQTICSNLKVFQLQYKFKLTVRTNRLNKMRCKFTLICQIQRMYSLIYLSLKVFNQSSTVKLKQINGAANMTIFLFRDTQVLVIFLRSFNITHIYLNCLLSCLKKI